MNYTKYKVILASMLNEFVPYMEKRKIRKISSRATGPFHSASRPIF